MRGPSHAAQLSAAFLDSLQTRLALLRTRVYDSQRTTAWHRFLTAAGQRPIPHASSGQGFSDAGSSLGPTAGTPGGSARSAPRQQWDSDARSDWLGEIARYALSAPSRPDPQPAALPPPPFSFWSSLFTPIVMTLTKIWFRLPVLGPRSVSIRNQKAFERLVQRRPRDQPIVTVSNHAATVDDPVIWSSLPYRFAVMPHRYSRWTLAAKEVAFVNRFADWFFTKAQCIPIVRGLGVYQAGVDRALDRMARGGWIHIFSEGRVHQGQRMLRFKWGVGRMLMEPSMGLGCKTPWFVPVYARGLEMALPLHRIYIPRPGHDFMLAFGDPVDFGPIVRQVLARTSDPDLARARLTSVVEDLVTDLQIRSIEWWLEKLGRTPSCLIKDAERGGDVPWIRIPGAEQPADEPGR
ncbi:acyltransferase-domain-containing protein [Hyaloraphidium curvatum]|nr:acyltransferase-domain-containing protein [Hyaloraphidium curvatum]